MNKIFIMKKKTQQMINIWIKTTIQKIIWLLIKHLWESEFGCINWYLILKKNDILIESMYIFMM